MTKLEALLERMKADQRELIHAAANVEASPSDGALRRISALEAAIGAVEHLIEEEGRESKRK